MRNEEQVLDLSTLVIAIVVLVIILNFLLFSLRTCSSSSSGSVLVTRLDICLSKAWRGVSVLIRFGFLRVSQILLLSSCRR